MKKRQIQEVRRRKKIKKRERLVCERKEKKKEKKLNWKAKDERS
jgi:hypothetical protein